MSKRKAFFSIYILIFTIFGGVLHGPFMALAEHIDSMDNGIERSFEMDDHTSMHHNSSQIAFEKRLELANGSGNSLMPCCEEKVINPENGTILQERKNDLLDVDVADFEKTDVGSESGKFSDVEFPNEYSPPPEETILSSVIRLE